MQKSAKLSQCLKIISVIQTQSQEISNEIASNEISNEISNELDEKAEARVIFDEFLPNFAPVKMSYFDTEKITLMMSSQN